MLLETIENYLGNEESAVEERDLEMCALPWNNICNNPAN
jgi:hypothetical protein